MAGRMKMEWADGVARNIERIGALFPGCVTEARGADGRLRAAIDFERLRQELSDEAIARDETYAFTWVGKRAAIAEANRPIRKTLRPCPEDSVDWDATENLYIEGDNLDVLKLLQESYFGKVKVIYIDPPYNTGSDRFVYSDTFAVSEEEYLERSGAKGEDGTVLFRENNFANPRFHSDWLSMMYPRLLLARNLLSDDGVIFISIDENEVSNLQKLCNEAFGERNYAATFLWTRTNTPPALSCKCRKTVEYVLAYEKRRSALKYFGAPLDGGDAPLLNAGNPEKTLRFPRGSIRFPFLRDGGRRECQRDPPRRGVQVGAGDSGGRGQARNLFRRQVRPVRHPLSEAESGGRLQDADQPSERRTQPGGRRRDERDGASGAGGAGPWEML